ncbi:Asp-tRNA(Asn)/Glu-tRNA(Gln) amidotransferase GatCAB subunit B [Candidatus Pacearchaeota archaeon CG10_big_fil_rev_8_21_14_0_10_34_12]|nr:MAG: Asp-tRNA(Asn)/Glu-tRNA(Gln) amidotransferase GatCAB subunit B [Candidatus Pacearchaeota archaeon CG10_big_fil_rev_8_21_14_0_10_34_12]
MPKIGLEIHGYLSTKEKLFCKCKAIHGSKFAKPNTFICPICTGQPGAKPLLPNKTAINEAVQISLILNCKISPKLVWQRKHYNWPDLPKGFQNTLSGPYASPVGVKGEFEGIRITEAHLEEDPAAWNPLTGEINYNKSGSPLIEIVTDPDFTSSEQVIEWMRQLLTTLTYMKLIDKSLGIKADVNVSLPEKKGSRVEMKNINSISNIKTAIEYEIKRQSSDVPKVQETRMFDEKTQTTIKMRSKEQAEDYRFISEPDLPIIKITKKRIGMLKSEIPESPKEKIKKIVKKYKIDRKNAEVLTKNLDVVEFFEDIIKKTNPKLATYWTTGELLRILNYAKKTLGEVNIQPSHFIELLDLIDKKQITELKAKEILNKFIPESFSPKKELKIHGKISNDEIEKIAEKTIRENPKAVKDYQEGKKESLNFLIGQVMKQSDKRADFSTAKKILEEKLN